MIELFLDIWGDSHIFSTFLFLKCEKDKEKNVKDHTCAIKFCSILFLFTTLVLEEKNDKSRARRIILLSIICLFELFKKIGLPILFSFLLVLALLTCSVGNLLLQSLEFWNISENKTTSQAAHEGLIAALAASYVTGLVASASHDKLVKLWK